MIINDFEKLSLRKFKIKSILPDSTILILGRRRSGKCLMKGEKILMYDGTIRKVEDIKVGDLVMGDDSTPRTVLETHSGKDTLYKITNKKGESYTVNSHHILSLIYTTKKNIIDRQDRKSYHIIWFNKDKCKLNYKTFSYKNQNKDEIYNKAKKFLDNIIDDRKIDISIQDFLKLSKKYRNNLLGYQVPIEFPEKNTPIDPYIIGFCLGNMNEKLEVITQNSRILHFLAKNLSKSDLCLDLCKHKSYCYKISNCNNKNNNHLQFLKDLFHNKHIPHVYKCNSRQNRLKLLAGLIDAIGHLNKNKNTGFEIFQNKNHQILVDDIIYLAHSLGFLISKSLKNDDKLIKLYISGQGLNKLPTLIIGKQVKTKNQRTDGLTSKISIKEMGQGDYCGIELDGNNRFILGNFIVTHNSFLVRDIFYHHKDIPSGVIFSGTEEASPFFGDFIPDCFIHSEYDPELIDSIMNHQKRKIREAKDRGLSESGKHASNNVFIVLDDMLHDAQSWKKDKTIKSIFFNGRHYNFLFILTMQYAQGIPPDLRSNIDYVFIFNEPSVANRKRIYDAYAGMIPSFDHFCNILDACTQNHECLVIKTTGNSSNLRDQVFWYKAEPHINFRVGHPKLWKYHNSNYNKNYELEQEQNQEELDKLKRKFAKTRKLKVIVSRQGDIVGYKQDE